MRTPTPDSHEGSDHRSASSRADSSRSVPACSARSRFASAGSARSRSASARADGLVDEQALVRSWRDQLIEVTLPGVGPIVAAPEPRLGDPVELDHTWLVIPALGPVIPTSLSEGALVADLSGRHPTVEVRRRRAAREEPARSRWMRRPEVASAVRAAGSVVGFGALVGPGRAWFEPAVAARADLLGPGLSAAVEVALRLARDAGQAAVLRLGEGTLDVLPAGCDPWVPELRDLPLQVFQRPRTCPVDGRGDLEACRPHGGPWVRASVRANLEWEARRSLAVGLLGCDSCCGEPLPVADPSAAGSADRPRPGRPPLARVQPLSELTRLVVRAGGTVRIDPDPGAC